MSVSKLVSSISEKGKQKIITGTVVNVLGNRCTVILSGNGGMLKGIEYIGTKPIVGSKIIVNYQNNIPQVYSVSSGMNSADPLSTTAILESTRNPTTHPTEHPGQASDHNSLPGLQGGVGSSDSETAEYFHLSEADYNELIAFLADGLISDAAGEENDIQYKGSDDKPAGDTNLKWRSSSESLQVGNPDSTGLQDVFPTPSFYAFRHDGQATVIFIANFEDNTLGIRGPQFRAFRAGGTPGDPDPLSIHDEWGVIQDGMALVTLTADGWSGGTAKIKTGGRISLVADDDWDDTSTPTRWSFYVLKHGQIAAHSDDPDVVDPGFEAMRIDGYSEKFNLPLDIPSVEEPDSPSISYGRIWVDDDTKHIFFKNSDGVVFDLTTGGTGSGVVISVTGDGVDNSDPVNPVISYPTPSDIGIGNVDNTHDADKPVSTAQAAADAVVLASAETYANSLVFNLNGFQGIPGEDGQDGMPGINGKDGRDGVQGEKGLQGEPGEDGQNGNPGLSLTDISNSNVVTRDLHVKGTFSNYNEDLVDMGSVPNSDIRGYGRDYITDKSLNNVTIGGNGNASAGGIRVLSGVLQIYLNGTWNNIVTNFSLREDSTFGYTFEHQPIGFTSYIEIMTGQSLSNLGLNGLPITNGYTTSMGAYPAPAIIGGRSII